MEVVLEIIVVAACFDLANIIRKCEREKTNAETTLDKYYFTWNNDAEQPGGGSCPSKICCDCSGSYRCITHLGNY